MGTPTSNEKQEREELRFLLLKSFLNPLEQKRLDYLKEKLARAPKDKMVRVGSVKTK